MVQIAFLALALIGIGMNAARAQDVAGIEDCTKTTGLDKRTGCLQSNVNFLQRLAMKNALETAQKLKATEDEIVTLKAGLAKLQKTFEQLAAAQKTPGDKKPDAK